MSTIWQLGILAAGAILTGLLLAVGHWFPWVRRLPRLTAYTYGVSSILIGFSLWRLLNQDWLTVAGLVIICIAGGAVVKMAYQVDHWVLTMRKAHKAEAVKRELD
jgi:ABC-type multidrug transport system permease subunit